MTKPATSKAPMQVPPLPPKELIKPEWDKQGWETDRDFQRFLVFKDLGKERSLIKAQAKASGKPIAAMLSGYWGALSRNNRWQERVAAFDTVEALKVSESVRSAREIAATEGEWAMADLMASIRELAKRDIDPKRREELIRAYGPTLLILCGKGGAGAFLLNSYKVLFGEKHEVVKKVTWEFD